MAPSYVGQVSANDKHHEPALTSQKVLSKSSLGLDLRFEQTYLKSIAPHVRLMTPAPGGNECLADPRKQRLEIKWGEVIWITTRDQVFAPLLQGVIWYVSVFPPPLSLFHICHRSRGNLYPWVQYFRGGFAPSSKYERPSRTGVGIAKLKSWLSSIIPPTPTASFRTR